MTTPHNCNRRMKLQSEPSYDSIQVGVQGPRQQGERGVAEQH